MSKKKQKHPNLYCTYSEKSAIIHDDYGHAGSYTGSTETSTESHLTGVVEKQPNDYLYHLTPIKDLKEGDEIPAKVHAVVVIYSTGDTFSHESGRLAVEGLYADFDKANKVALRIKTDDYPGYAPWSGYFESVESVYIQTEEVADKSKITKIL